MFIYCLAGPRQNDEAGLLLGAMSTPFSQIRPLVFDLDGTLIDSRNDITAACNYALAHVGRGPLSAEEIASHVGSGARALLQGVLGQVPTKAEFDELFARFQRYYLDHPTDLNSFMPGALDALRLRSQERPVALCTNKPMHLTERVIKSLGWENTFDAIVGPNLGDRVKPDPQLLERVADQLGVPAASIVMIGDGPQDVGAGKAVGAHTVGVKGGLMPLPRLLAAEPDVLLDTLEGLPDYLIRLEGNRA